MTDNEKRAHDLSLSYYQRLIEFDDVDNWAKGIETSKDIDIYAIYKALYDKLLIALNRDYPSVP